MSYKTAREFDFYNQMGVDLNSLGCVMLDTNSPIEGGFEGSVNDFHVTVRYGFLVPPVRKVHVEEILADLYVPNTLIISDLTAFPMEGDKEVIVALIDSYALGVLNQALSVLPNIATFPEYRPHVTLGYYDKGSFDDLRKDLYSRLKDTVKVGAYSYNKVFDQ